MHTHRYAMTLGALVLIVASALLWLGLPGFGPGEEGSGFKQATALLPDSRVRPGNLDPEMVSRKELERIRLEIAALRQQLLGLDAEQNALYQSLEELDLGTMEGDAAPAREEEELANAEPSAEEQVQAKIYALADQLEDEARDHAWTLWAEAELEQGLEHGDLEGGTLLETECRSTVCRMQLAFEDQETRDLGLESLPFLVPWEANGFVHFDEGDPLSVVVYVAREGEALR